MAIDIKIPKEINEFQEKLFFNLTPRALLAVGIIGITCVPLYIFGNSFFPPEIVQIAILLISIPVGVLGFYPMHNGQKTEEFFVSYLRHMFGEQERFYSELPVFWYNREEIIQDILAEERARELINNPKKKRGKKNGK